MECLQQELAKRCFEMAEELCIVCFLFFFSSPKKVLLSFVPVLLIEMLLMKLNGLSFLWEGLS